MAPKNLKDLKLYENYLYAQKKPFSCPHCQEYVLAKHYEKHCKTHHHLNPLVCCVWCFGGLTWPNRNKCLNGQHLKLCSRRFLNRTSKIQSTPLSFDKTPLCPAKDLFGRPHDPQPRAYEPIWPVPLPPNLLLFNTESLNQALSCLQLYLQLHDTTYWTHAVVRAAAFPSFLEAIDSDEGRTRTLPFSCWCDGGTHLDSRHRHLILVAPSRLHFERHVWKKISPTNQPEKHFRCKSREPIVSALHLVNTLGYVSQLESSEHRNDHFYIFQSLPVDYKLVLVTQWPGGLAQLLRQECRNLRWEELIRAPLTHADGQWQMRVQDIPGIRLGAVLPVARDWVPCSELTTTTTTTAALHLLDGKRLYFERHSDLAHLPPDLWLQEQAARGNMLYDAVGESWYTPRPFHQRLVNTFKPEVDRVAEMEAELASERAESERRRERLEASERENKSLRRETKILQKKLNRLYEGEIKRLKQELSEAKEESRTLKRKLAERDEEIHDLKRKLS